MAFMSKEEVQKVRETIKNSFPKEYKFSITSYHYSGVSIALISSPIEYPTDYKQVSEYHIDSQFKDNEEMRNLLTKVKDLVHSIKHCYNRNANDPSADYGDNNYFLNMSIGKWDKSYNQLKTKLK